jgi:GNAT superfamily N-acetyltransferase
MVVPVPISSAAIELLDATVWAELHGRFVRGAGDALGVVERWGSATVLASGITDAVALNRAIGFGFEQACDAEQLGTLRTFFRRQRKTRWFLECSPDASIDRTAIAASGAVVGGAQVKLVATLDTLDSLPAPRLYVEEATASDASCFMNMVGSQLQVPECVRPAIVSTIGQPGWHFYFAMLDDGPVAGAAMFVEGGGAWLGWAATLPEYRNRGAQSALLVRRIRDAKAAGCRWVSADADPASSAPNPSLRNMTRLGLRERYHRPWYRFEETYRDHLPNER